MHQVKCLRSPDLEYKYSNFYKGSMNETMASIGLYTLLQKLFLIHFFFNEYFSISRH